MELAEMMDLSDSIKQGYLLLEDPIDKVECTAVLVRNCHQVVFIRSGIDTTLSSHPIAYISHMPRSQHRRR
jgi:hypothetical protein